MAEHLREVSLTNLADEFERVADEDIAYAVLAVSWAADDEAVPADMLGVRLTWDEARPFLDYGFDLGGWEGPRVSVSAMAWSENWVICVHEYDTAHSVMRVPCFPIDGEKVGAPIAGDGW